MKLRALAAAVLIAAAGSGLAGCAAFENTLDIGPAHIVPVGNGIIIAQLKVKVIKEPRSIEAHTRLEYKFRGKWIVQDAKIYRKKNLPPRGKDEYVKPFLEAICVPGLWRVHLSVYGVTQDGTVVPTQTAWYPRKKGLRIRKCDERK